MKSATRLPSLVRTLSLGATVGLAGLFVLTGSAGESGKSSAEDAVRELQKQFRAERDALLKSGGAKRFLPHLLDKAELIAKRGDEALAEGRFLQAREAFRNARWQLPYQAPELPDHVTRVFGNLRLRHSHEVWTIAFSPDGQRLASAGRDRTVRIWDMSSGREVLTYLGHYDYLRAVAFSPDGKTIASAGGEKEVRLWDAHTGKDIRTFAGAANYLTTLAFSPDGKLLATGSDDRKVRLYEVATGILKRTTEEEIQGMIQAVAFHPEGKLLAVASADGSVRVWNVPRLLEDPKQPAFWQKTSPGGSSYHVAFSPDGKTLAKCSPTGAELYHTPSPEVSGIQAQNPRLEIKPPEGRGRFNCLTFSKDGKLLFTGGTDNMVRLWDAQTGQALGQFQGHTGEIKALAYNAATSQLASASTDYTIRLWQFAIVEQARLECVGHDGAVWYACFSPDGRYLLSGGADRTLRLWEPLTGKLIYSWKAHNAPVTVVLFSPDGKKILSGSGDHVLKLWNASTRELLHTLEGHEETITSAAFSPDGKYLVSSSVDERVKIWDAETGKVLQTLTDSKSIVTWVAFRPDGKQVAAATVNHKVLLWDVVTGKLSSSWTAHNGAVNCVAYSANGQLLASCGNDGLVKVWRLNSPGTAPIILSGHVGPVSSVAFRLDNRLLASAGSDRVVKLWKLDLDHGKEEQNFRGHKDWISSVTFSKDGFYLVSAGVDQTVKTWEVTSREIVLQSEHTGAVDAVAVSPDGKLLASGAGDRTIKLWDINTGIEQSTLAGHPGRVVALTFSPDSKTLVSAHAFHGSTNGKSDYCLRLWDVASGRALPKKEGHELNFEKMINAAPVLTVTPDGKRLVAWILGNERYTTLSVFELATGKQLLTFNDQGRDVGCVAFTVDGTKAALGAQDGSVRLYRLDKKGEPEPGGDWFVYDKKVGVGDLAFSPDGKLLLTGGENGEIKVWNIQKRQALRSFKGHAQRVCALAVSPDGKRFVSSGYDNVIKLWETETGKELRRWELHLPLQEGRAAVQTLVFTPDGKQVATANANTTLYLLELP
jgi:WD40 repeat protein